MEKLHDFNSFSRVRRDQQIAKIEEEKEARRASSAQSFKNLLSEYGVSEISELNDNDKSSFFERLKENSSSDDVSYMIDRLEEAYITEGNAFSAARAKAIANGDSEFTVDGETYPVEGVDKEDKENAEEFAGESKEFNEAVDTETVVQIELEDGIYYIKPYGDSTHFYMSIMKDGIENAIPSHIGQHRNRPYYNDLRKYLKGGANIDGNSYVDESVTNETRFYAFHKDQKHEIEADSLWAAKQKAITDLKVKKKDVGLLAVVNADLHDDFSSGKNAAFAFENEVNEAEVKSADEFKEYAFTVLKKAFGDDFDEDKAQETIDGILSKAKEDYGVAVGMLQSSLG